MSKCVTFTASSPSIQLYNDGNDDIAKMNRFAFPSISFSPSFPLNMSPNLPRPGAALLAPSSPASASNVLSPRSAHRGGISCSAHSGMATSPHSNPKQLPSYFSPATSEESSGLLSAWSLESPLPPLSPRGQKLADSEKYHNAKCLNRIVEKRRKASDGTADIVVSEVSPVPQTHVRKVSFDVSLTEEQLESYRSLRNSLPTSSLSKQIETIHEDPIDKLPAFISVTDEYN